MANLFLNRLTNTIAMQRKIMVHGASRLLGLQVVNEYPKSGGTWIGLLLSDALGIPFPQNQRPPLRRCIMHGHYLRKTGMHRPVIVWRDGRDVMSSLYHHSYFKFEGDPRNHFHVDLYRQTHPFEDYDDIRGNMPRFIEQQFTRPLSPAFSWSDFVNVWTAFPSRIDVFYEDFRRDTLSALRRTLEQLDPAEGIPERDRLAHIVDRRSFDRAKAAETVKPGQHSFLRKGAVEGWREEFSPEALAVFDHFAGAALDKLGYPRTAGAQTHEVK